MVSRKVYFAQIVAALSLVLLVGCGPTTPTKPQSGETLQERAVKRWNFLIEHKAEKAYDYLTPGFRATKSRDVYAREMNGRGMKWLDVTFNSEECNADTCTVRLLVNIEIDMTGSVGHVKTMSPVVETWIKESGNWYYLPDATRSPNLKGRSKP
jgi:Putative cell wall binding repeat